MIYLSVFMVMSQTQPNSWKPVTISFRQGDCLAQDVGRKLRPKQTQTQTKPFFSVFTVNFLSNLEQFSRGFCSANHTSVERDGKYLLIVSF